MAVNQNRRLLVFFLALLTGSLTTAGSSWSDKTPPTIGVRNAHAMAYDSVVGRVILFGGADELSVRGDTWEWNDRKWVLVSQTGPGPRTFPAMTYDNLRNRIVLFGGNRVLFGKSPDENKFLSDTWEWDGRKWTQIKADGPSPRAEAAIAFDSRRGRVVLFGGHNRVGPAGSRLGDTWEWDGKRWTEMKVTGPSARNSAALAYDSARGISVLFGGSTQEGVSGETWGWNGQEWVENRAALTEGRFNSAMAYDAARRKVIRFGGRFAGRPVGDTWEYDGKRWKRLTSTGPTARNHAAMVYDSKSRKIVLFGGHDFGTHDWVNIFGDTWEWDGVSWSPKGKSQIKHRLDNGH
jgi:hypothetical protein